MRHAELLTDSCLELRRVATVIAYTAQKPKELSNGSKCRHKVEYNNYDADANDGNDDGNHKGFSSVHSTLEPISLINLSTLCIEKQNIRPLISSN